MIRLSFSLFVETVVNLYSIKNFDFFFYFTLIRFYNKKHLKNVGPIRQCEPPLHCHSPGVATPRRSTALPSPDVEMLEPLLDADDRWSRFADTVVH